MKRADRAGPGGRTGCRPVADSRAGPGAGLGEGRMAGAARRDGKEAADAGIARGWPAQALGWGLFVFVELMTRLTVFDDLRAALGVSLLLAPVVVALAVLLRAVLDGVAEARRVTAPALPWIVGLSLAAALVAAAAGHFLRGRLGLDIAAWSRGEEVLLSLVYYFMIFVIWCLICVWMRAEAARRAARRRATEAEAEALRTEVQRLRLQLDPHFMLNALNGIGEEIQEHPAAALAMLHDLATFLRQSLAGIGETIVAVAAEAEALACYLRVQEARFGRRLTLRIEVAEAALPRRLPGFLLQPLVENAIEHARRAPTFEVAVTLRLQDEALEAVITNPGRLDAGVAARGRTGIGLANVRRRLALHYPGRHAFTLTEAEGTVVARLLLEGEPCAVP